MCEGAEAWKVSAERRGTEAWKVSAEGRSVWRYGNFGGMRRTASGKQEEKIAGNGGKVI